MATKSAKHTHARKTTRTRTVARMARTKKGAIHADIPLGSKKGAPIPFVPTAPAAPPPKPEPTFKITEFGEAFGYMVGAPSDAQNPVVFARNALDDAWRTLRLAEEFLVGHIDFCALQDVVSNAAKRAEIADKILQRFEVRS